MIFDTIPQKYFKRSENHSYTSLYVWFPHDCYDRRPDRCSCCDRGKKKETSDRCENQNLAIQYNLNVLCSKCSLNIFDHCGDLTQRSQSLRSSTKCYAFYHPNISNKCNQLRSPVNYYGREMTGTNTSLFASQYVIFCIGQCLDD